MKVILFFKLLLIFTANYYGVGEATDALGLECKNEIGYWYIAAVVSGKMLNSISQ